MRKELAGWVERTAHAIGISMQEMQGFMLLFWRQNSGNDEKLNVRSAAELARIRQNDFHRFVRANRNSATLYCRLQMRHQQDLFIAANAGWIGAEQNQAMWAGRMAHRLTITASEMYDLLVLYHAAIAGKHDVSLAVTAQSAMNNEADFLQFVEEWIGTS